MRMLFFYFPDYEWEGQDEIPIEETTLLRYNTKKERKKRETRPQHPEQIRAPKPL